jgi:hypothetical protein
MPARRPTSPTQRVLLWTLVGVVALAALAVVRVPRGAEQERRIEATVPEGAEVAFGFVVDTVDANRSSMKLRIQAALTEDSPPEGVTLFTTIGAAPVMTASFDKITPEQSVDVAVDAGDVSDYPFDRYRTEITLAAVSGTDAKVVDLERRPKLRLAVVGAVLAAGVDVTADAREQDGLSNVTIDAKRSAGVRGWVMAMMVLYWALAAAALAVTVVTVRGQRAWETRQLAWLGSMIFALVALRNAAPASPPIGTYLDFYAFFVAVAVVSGSLLALVTYFLVQPREVLKL